LRSIWTPDWTPSPHDGHEFRDHVDFGIVTDRDQIDDAWALVDGTAAALDELETAICGKRAAAANGRSPSARTPA
jgi:hypothetical protein